MSAFAPLWDGSHLSYLSNAPILQEPKSRQTERLVRSICCKTPSEVTLGAKLQVDRVLIAELVARGRLGGCRTENRRALEFLIEVDP
jgi:hypothetical protein